MQQPYVGAPHDATCGEHETLSFGAICVHVHEAGVSRIPGCSQHT
jgi:hypothetical protein